MKETLIKFNERHHEGGEWHLGESGTGNDTTLCGLAHEGACDHQYLGASEPEDEIKKGTMKDITCKQCLSIIALCKGLK